MSTTNCPEFMSKNSSSLVDSTQAVCGLKACVSATTTLCVCVCMLVCVCVCVHAAYLSRSMSLTFLFARHCLTIISRVEAFEGLRPSANRSARGRRRTRQRWSLGSWGNYDNVLILFLQSRLQRKYSDPCLQGSVTGLCQGTELGKLIKNNSAALKVTKRTMASIVLKLKVLTTCF